MKKINLCVAMLGTVAMTACTDYKAEITEAHDDFVRNVGTSFGSAGKSSGCTCALLETNLLRDASGRLYYDYGLLGDNDIYWKVDGCNADYTFAADMVESGAGTFVYTGSSGYGSSLDVAARVTVGGPYTSVPVSIGVNVMEGDNFVETLACPSVDVHGMIYGSSSEASGSTVCGDLWCGIRDYTGQVNTGFAQDDDTGYWYEYTDATDGGYSTFQYPISTGNGDYFAPIIQAFGGIKGYVALEAGYEYPFAGLAFDLVNASRKGADVTDWEGLCLVYSTNKRFSLKIAVEDEANVVEYNNYMYRMPIKNEVSVVDIPWTSFKQESGWGKQVSRSYVLKRAAAIVLEFNGNPGETGDFFIQSIGRLGTCL